MRLTRHGILLSSALALAAGCTPADAPKETPEKKTSLTPASEPAAAKPAAVTSDEGAKTPTTEATPAAVADNTNEDASPAGEETVPAVPGEQPAEEEKITLTYGSGAPPLTLASWVKGEPVTAFKSGQIYVVEFWATWCGPCRVSMPHLSELQKKYGDKVRFIGISDEDAETVNTFLQGEQQPGKTWDQAVEYSLALDQGRTTNTAYMRASGQGGIPTAFIVGGDGVIDWIGHPMAMDAPLEKVVAGTWDRALAKAEFEEEQRFQTAQMAVSREIRTAIRSEDWNAAVAIVDRLMAEFPKKSSLKLTKAQFLSNAQRNDEGGLLVEEAVKDAWDTPGMLNEISWAIANKGLPGSLELAEKAAARGVELTNEKDASVLDTLARVYFEQGRLDDAVTCAKKAVEVDGSIPQIAEALKRYEEAKAAAAGAPPADAAKTTESAPATDGETAAPATESATETK